MSITNDVQMLEPGKKIRLISVDGSVFEKSLDVLYFHCNEIPFTEAEIAAANGDESKLPAKSLWFDGHEYKPWPFELTGISSSSDGQTAEPSLKVANLDGSITALCLATDDMVQAQVTISDTFSQYLDAKNFIGGNPSADPSQSFKQLWYIDSKTSEDNEVVEFKLASPLDLLGLMIPTRQITSLCTWACRGQYKSGNGCHYSPGSHGNRMFTLKGVATTDPALDKCSGLLEDCQKRYGETNELDFGGFPGSSLLRR